MLGVLVNTVTVLIGGLIGCLLKKGLPEKLTTTVMWGVGLCVTCIGIDGMLEGNNAIIMVVSLALGGLLGALIGIDRGLNRLGDWVSSKMQRGDSLSNVGQGFVSGSLLFCVGAMTVVGSLEAGISADYETLYTKALIDMISALVLATTLGGGVMLSAVSIFIVQGGIVLLAGWIQPLLTTAAIAEMSAAGSVLIMSIGLNMLGITKIKVADLLPAVIIAPIVCRLIGG